MKSDGEEGVSGRAPQAAFTPFVQHIIANRIPTPCMMVTQVQDGEFVRVYPKKPGTLDCKKRNTVEVETDLLGG